MNISGVSLPLDSITVDPSKNIGRTEQKSELSEFAKILSDLSKPDRDAKELQKQMLSGAPVNIDELKFAQMQSGLVTDLVTKSTNKVVNFIESTFSMQV